MATPFTVRNEVDFIALAPIVIGFQPERSIVMMTVNSFHARVDLPDDDQIEECVQALLQPVQRHKVDRVAFVVFDGEERHQKAEKALVDTFVDAGVEVLAAVEVVGGKYRQFGSGDWQQLDLTGHPFTLEALYIDKAPSYDSREAMREHVRPCGEGWSGEAADAVEHLQEAGVEEAITALTRKGAARVVPVWTDALRGSEAGTELAEDIAVVLAFAAWLSGDGALAWVALDVADSENKWHQLLSTALEQAVSPDQWPGAR